MVVIGMKMKIVMMVVMEMETGVIRVGTKKGGGGWTRGKIREVKIGQDEEDCVGLSTSGHW